MSAEDDPEERIRELERSAGDQPSELTRSWSEVGSGRLGSPYPGQVSSSGAASRGWSAVALIGAVLLTIVVGAAIFVAKLFSGVDSFIDAFESSPTASSGGAPLVVPPDHGDSPLVPTVEAIVPPGGNVSVSGVGEHRNITCNEGAVSISGVSNTVVLTGRCRNVMVSGVQNVVTVDDSAVITASGFDNRITYLSGSPEIQNVGDSNVVQRG